ncbi:MAG: CrcB family protein [Bacteroides sp.]|nr:CrcB family protein [Bacteroides sp.]
MTESLANILAVGGGSAMGAICRYGAGLLPWLQGSRCFPTLTVNIVGSILIGVAWTLFERHETLHLWYMFLVTGFLGGFTTFSTFSLDAVILLKTGRLWEFAGYALVTLTVCIVGCLAAHYTTARVLHLPD